MEQNKNVIPKKESLIELEKKLGFTFPESWLFAEHAYPTYEEFLNIPKTEEQEIRLDRMFRNSDDKELAYYENTKYFHENGFITPIETFLNVHSRLYLNFELVYYLVKPYDELAIVVYNDYAKKNRLTYPIISNLNRFKQITSNEFYKIYKDFL